MLKNLDISTPSYIFRPLGSWFDPKSNWTKMFMFRYNQSNFPASFVNPWGFRNDNTYADPYINLGASAGNTDLLVEWFDGITYTDTVATTLVVLTNYWIAIRYTAVSHLLEFLIDGIVVGSITADLSSFAPTNEFMLDDGSSSPVAAIGYELFYQSALTNAQILAQKTSISALVNTNLLSHCLLQTSIDLTDHNGNARQFTAVDTVITDTSDPLLSIVAGPPTNTSPGTATVVNANSAVFQDTLSAGVSQNVWFKYTPAVGVKVISIWGMRTGGSYIPKLLVATSLANANSAIFDYSGGFNGGIQFSVTFGNTYYIKVLTSGTGSPSTLLFSLLEGLNLPVPIGSYAISDDDSSGVALPLVLMDKDTGYPLNFSNGFAQGEGAEAVSNGNVLASNEHVASNIKLYNGSLVLLKTTAIVGTRPGSGHVCIASNRINKYLVALEKDANNLRLYTVDENGNITKTQDLAAASIFLTALGVLPDFSFAYVALTDSANKPIKCINLATGAYAADLNAGLANYGAGRDILCYSTTCILVPYYRQSGGVNSAIIKKYDNTGAVLATFNYDTYVNGSTDILDFRICSDPDETYFHIWVKGLLQGHDYLIKCLTADGSVVKATPNLDEYESGAYIASLPQNTPQRFGHSESCPFWVTRNVLFPTNIANSGLYYLTGTGLTAISRHDTIWDDTSLGTKENVKIPDPYFESFLAGDE